MWFLICVGLSLSPCYLFLFVPSILYSPFSYLLPSSGLSNFFYDSIVFSLWLISYISLSYYFNGCFRFYSIQKGLEKSGEEQSWSPPWALWSFLEDPILRDTLGSNTWDWCGILRVNFILSGAVYPVCKTLISFSLTTYKERLWEKPHIGRWLLEIYQEGWWSNLEIQV